MNSNKMLKVLPVGILFILLLGLVSANVEIVEESVNLDVNYNQFTNEDQTSIIENSDAFTIENSGSDNITVQISAEGLPTDYSFETKEVTINANSSQSISLALNLTHVEGNGEKEIGTIVIKEINKSSQLDSAKIIQNTTNMVELTTSIKYTSKDGKSEKDSFSDLDSFTLDEEVKPGSEVEITFKLKNLFDNSYDEDKSVLEDITIELSLDDEELVDDDFEEDHDLEDIEAGKKEEYTINFIVDEDADEGDYNLEIKLEAEDGNQADYEIKTEITLNVERIKDDVIIYQAELNPNQVTTCENSFSLDVGLKNLGTRDQNLAAISIYNEKLDLNENIQDIKIQEHSDSDNTWSKKFTYSLDQVKKGTYPIDVNAYINKDDSIDYKRVDLEVVDCPVSATKDNEEVEESSTEDNKEKVEDKDASGNGVKEETQATTGDEGTNKVTSSTIVSTVEDPYTIHDYMVGIIIVAIIIVLALIVVFFVALVK